MKKSKRLYFRTTILIILLSLVGYTLYNNLVGEKSKQPNVGDVAPNFKLETLNGEKVELRDLRGKVVLINFWGTWCKPCQEEMPAIQKVYDKYKEEGFEVLAVNLGESELAITKFRDSTNVDFPILKDKDSLVTEIYGVYLLPASFFINRDGEIVKTFEGELDITKLNDWVSKNL